MDKRVEEIQRETSGVVVLLPFATPSFHPVEPIARRRLFRLFPATSSRRSRLYRALRELLSHNRVTITMLCIPVASCNCRFLVVDDAPDAGPDETIVFSQLRFNNDMGDDKRPANFPAIERERARVKEKERERDNS